VWGAKDEAPAKTRFTAAGEKAEKVVWIGGKKILFLEKYARSPKLASNDKDGKTTVGEPAQIKKTVLEEFRLFDTPGGAGELRRGRMTDGVLQWLDDDLHPIDQIMLPEGAKLSSFLPLAADDAWALEAGGAQIHRLKADKSGIMRVNDSIKLNGGNAVVNDPVLGMMLIGQRFVAQMTPGKPFELKVVQTIDSREGRPSGVKQATIHRIITTDVTGDGADDVLLCDDLRHQFSLLMRQDNGDLKALMSWPVFEDKAYPYGGPDGTPRGAEPRNVVGLDLDGDKQQDLAMLCHDRILIYIGREEK
jgi:hypothetical protein